MKLKRVLLLILVFSMLGVMTVFASDSFQWYRGKDVKVIVNGKELNSSGLLINDTTMIPLREISETLQAIVSWNESTQTVSIVKPNVHLTPVEVRKNGVVPFGHVVHKGKYDVSIFSQIDNLSTSVHSYKIEIVDPHGTVIHSEEHDMGGARGDIWFGSDKVNLEFKELGNYVIKAYMKVESRGNYHLVSEKFISSLSRTR